MIKSLKNYFLARVLREKILLVAFILIGAAIWFSGFSNRAGAFWRQQKILTARLADQTQWLNQQSQIDASAQRAVAKLDPSRTLNDTALVGQITAMASDLGLGRNLSVSDTRNESTSQFAIHSLRLTVSRADFASVVKLALEIRDRSPYIGLDEFVMNSEPSNRSQVAAQFHLSSVEVIH